MESLAGNDWMNFLPAVQAFLKGENPYLIGEGFNKVYEPFWTYIFLAPFALLPFWTGRILLLVTGFLAFSFSAIKMGASRWQLVLFLTSMPVIGGLHEGNIDWLVTLGLWMPPQIGLFFLLMKPQIGLCVAVFWLYMTWQEGGVKKVFLTFTPVTIAYLSSFLLYDFWILQLVDMPHNPVGDYGLFPYAIPLGLILMYYAIKKNDKRLSALSTPWVAPYVTGYNFASLLLCMFNRPRLFVFMWFALWIPMVIKIVLQ